MGAFHHLPGPCLLARSPVAGNPQGFSLSSQEESGSLFLIHQPTWNPLLYRHPHLPRAGGDNREEGPSSYSLAHTQLPGEPPGHLTPPLILTPGPPSWTEETAGSRGSRMNSSPILDLEPSLGHEIASFSRQLNFREAGRFARLLTLNARQSHRRAPPPLDRWGDRGPRERGSDSPRAKHLSPLPLLHAPYLDSALSAGGVAPSQGHRVSPGGVGGARGMLGVFSTPAAEGSVRCAESPAGLLAAGVDAGTAGAPALPARLGCPLPLDPVPPSLLSTWVAAAHPAGGLWGSHDPGYGLRLLPLPVCYPLGPDHL